MPKPHLVITYNTTSEDLDREPSKITEFTIEGSDITSEDFRRLLKQKKTRKREPQT